MSELPPLCVLLTPWEMERVSRVTHARFGLAGVAALSSQEFGAALRVVAAELFPEQMAAPADPVRMEGYARRSAVLAEVAARKGRRSPQVVVAEALDLIDAAEARIRALQPWAPRRDRQAGGT
jgi:hypothetical protein